MKTTTRIALATILTLSMLSHTFASTTNYKTAFQSLYGEARYEEAVELLENHLDVQPSDHEARMKLALTLLRLKETDFARTQIERLRAGGGEAERYANALDNLIASVDRQDELREQLSDALGNYDIDSVRSTVESMDLSDEQKAIVSMFVEIYAGDFEAARGQLKAFKPQRYEEHKKVKELGAEIDAAEVRFNALTTEIDAFYYSGDSTSTFAAAATEDVPAVQEFEFERYLEAVGELSQVAPLHPRSMDVTFHAAMLFTPYDELEALADRIMDAKGSIRIPFFSTDKHFDLVIDGESRRIRTEAKEIPYIATYTKTGSNASSNPHYSELDAFDHELSALPKFTQKVSHNYTDAGLDNGGHVFKFKGGGVAPNYALMPALHMFCGELAQKQATYNLGKLVSTLAERAGSKVQAKLVNPAKKSAQKKAIFGAVLAGIASVAGTQASAAGNHAASGQLQQLSTTLQTQVARMIVKSEDMAMNQDFWAEQLATRGFDFAEDLEFDRVEALFELS